MASSKDEFGSLLLAAIGGFALGRIAADSSKREANRAQFAKSLRNGLGNEGRKLIAANFGRDKNRYPFWKLTVQDSDAALYSVRVPLPKGARPYDKQTLDLVFDGIHKKVSA